MTIKEALEYIKNHGVWQFAAIHGWTKPDEKLIESFSTIEKYIEASEEIIKSIGFSLEFDESQNEWFLYIYNGIQSMLIAKGTGIKTYNLLKEVLE